MKVGIYVGSFNPVHKGHIKVVNYLLDNKYLDKVIIIPTLDYWDKHNLLDLNARASMLKFYQNDKIVVDTSNSKMQYTYQIMNEVKRNNPDYDLYLIIGADNIKDFDKWKNVKEILNNHIIVLARGSQIDVESYINRFKRKDQFIQIKDYEALNISSTMIRDKLKHGDLDDLNNYLDSEVLEYILNNKLYMEG